MFLKKLEIQGFKSFARKTVLEFEKGIISVVGPNGSGKSNFADAIRWVLGEQSLKAVRSKKSEDVIFAGSDKKSKLGMAEVGITFDNTDRKLPVDYTEVEISRRVFRDGEGEYLLNRQPVRLMDIVELLAKSGYGNNSYHVISQGTIDQMVIAGPGAIKNLIEEASGVKPYYLKRDRAVRKLERSEENLRRVADLTAEIEPRLRSLRRQAKRMEQREEIAAQMREAQQNFFVVQYHKIQKSLTEFESQVKYFDKQISELSGETEATGNSLKVLEQQTLKKSEDYKNLQETIRQQEREKNRVQEDLAIIRGRLKAHSPATGVDANAVKIRRSELAGKIRDLERQISDLKNQRTLSQRNLENHQKMQDNLSADIAKLTASIETAKNPFDLGRIKDDIEKVYSRYQTMLYEIKNLQDEADFEHLQQEAANLEILLVRLKDRFAQFSNIQLNHSELVHLNFQLQKIYQQKEQVLHELGKIQTEINSALGAEKFYASNLGDLKRELERLTAEFGSKPATDPDEQWTSMEKQESALNEELQKYFMLIKKAEGDLQEFLATEARQKKELLEFERQLRQKQDLLSKVKDQRGLVLIEKARYDAQAENVQLEIHQTLGQEQVEKIKNSSERPNEAGLEQKIQKFKAQLELIGGVDELTLQEYKETEDRYNYLTSQSKDLHSAIDDLREVIGELDAVIKRQFQNGFERINEDFSEYFRILFSGGRARMTLIKEAKTPAVPGVENGEGEAVAEEEEITEVSAMGKEEVTGIEIRATPPGKKLATLSALSGGERTLTSIALLMSILTAFPSPFVVLDEVDAALDEANSIRFGKILSRLAHQTQFLTITHNRETMRQAGMLYGITMGDDGISKVLSIKLDKAVEIAR